MLIYEWRPTTTFQVCSVLVKILVINNNRKMIEHWQSCLKKLFFWILLVFFVVYGVIAICPISPESDSRFSQVFRSFITTIHVPQFKDISIGFFELWLRVLVLRIETRYVFIAILIIFYEFNWKESKSICMNYSATFATKLRFASWKTIFNLARRWSKLFVLYWACSSLFHFFICMEHGW